MNTLGEGRGRRVVGIGDVKGKAESGELAIAVGNGVGDGVSENGEYQLV